MLLSRVTLRAHLVAELLPLWERHGLDRARGGYWNRLGPELRPMPDSHKRLLVHARQIFSFTRGAELGAGAWARAAAAHGLEFLVQRFWDARHGGWFTTTDDAGVPLDRRKDLYGHAFAIFALAHHYRVSAESESLRLARATLELLRARLRDPVSGGFFEGASEDWRPVLGPRRQNPHMHLVEALLVLAEVAPDSGALREARALVALLGARWLDARTGALGEHFDSRWRPLAGDAGRVVEPGHHFEWVWLLARLEALEPSDFTRALAARLLDFGRRFGVDADGGVFDQLDRAGQPLAFSKRLWAQTERVKALAVCARATGDADLRRELEAGLRYCFARHVDPKTRGWHEQLARDGRVLSEAQNATSVYHVVLALDEASECLGGD
jgi:mannose/cellobiose epimerase-like protein (N-acyl-D-glucosamine 2-epimerase family)